MKDNFVESKLGHHFAYTRMEQIKKYILAGISLNLVGIPGVGISITCRYIATQSYASMFYLDMYALSPITSEQLFRQLFLTLGGKVVPDNFQDTLTACHDLLLQCTKKGKKVVIIINRFHRLEKEFTNDFFSYIRFLQNTSKGNIIFLVTTYRPLADTHSEVIMGSNTATFSTFFLKPFSDEERKDLLLLSPTELKSKKEILPILSLSGGHAHLLQLLIRSVYVADPLMDKFIYLQLKIIEEVLTKKEKILLKKIAQDKLSIKSDSYLSQIGILDQKGHIFSFLFKNYLLSQLPIKLPKKESKLFSLLKKSKGKVVTKDTLFALLWKDNYEHATDWALNALIYRLRNNEYFKQTGFLIESYKGIGYRLVKN